MPIRGRHGSTVLTPVALLDRREQPAGFAPTGVDLCQASIHAVIVCYSATKMAEHALDALSRQRHMPLLLRGLRCACLEQGLTPAHD